MNLRHRCRRFTLALLTVVVLEGVNRKIYKRRPLGVAAISGAWTVYRMMPVHVGLPHSPGQVGGSRLTAITQCHAERQGARGVVSGATPRAPRAREP